MNDSMMDYLEIQKSGLDFVGSLYIFGLNLNSTFEEILEYVN